MSKKFNPALIGGFVLGGIALFVVMLLGFGSGLLFQKTQDYILFFDQSVNGLKVGAPVKFRGVEVGNVTSVSVSQPKDDGPVYIAVLIRAGRTAVLKGMKPTHDFVDKETCADAVKRGLRAQLKAQSLLSGDLYVNLNFFPDHEATFVMQNNTAYPEIPTISSGLIEDLTDSTLSVAASLEGTLTSLQNALQNIDQKLDPLTSEGIVALREMKTAMKSMDEFLDPQSPVGYQLPRTLEEVKEAAESIRLLADYLERNPSAVLFGKRAQEEVELQ